MPVTLAQAQVNVQDDIQAGVIDEFRKNNFLLNALTFDDAVSPTGGGATLTYGYTRVITQPTAAARAINAEYVAQEAAKQRYTCDLKIFGGAFQVDRVIAKMGGIINEVTFQMQQKIKATQALFNHMVVNGDSAQDARVFDGLDKALIGSSTEVNPAAAIDLSTSANVTTNWQAFLDELDAFLGLLDGQPAALMCNTTMKSKLRAIARRAAMYSVNKDNWGQQVEFYGPIPIIDLGNQPGTNNPIIGTDAGTGETAIYAARLGLDGFHAVSLAGQSPIITIMPDYKTAGAVKTGEVEMVSAVALKATKAAGVFRRVKVA